LLIENRAKTAILRRPVTASPISQTPLGRGILLAAVAVLAGCGSASAEGPIDVAALEFELATVTRLQQLSLGSELDMRASCTPSGSELQFSCRVDATSHGTPVNAWTVSVSCRPPGKTEKPRCTSDSGYALQ
jgi:hypothetical protein